MNNVNWFKKNSLPEIISLVSALTGVYIFIASTDTAQKVHIKYKLSNLKFEKPSHMDKVK